MRTTIAALALAVAIPIIAGSPASGQFPASPAPSFLLVGVIIPDAGAAMAILEDPQTHEQEIVTLGAQIDDGRLTKILGDRVVVTSGDVATEMRLAGPTPPLPASRLRSSRRLEPARPSRDDMSALPPGLPSG